MSEDEIQEQYEYHIDSLKETGIEPLPYSIFKTRFQKPDSTDRELLNLERDILLHPRNFHHLLMPVTDEIFVKDIYDKMVGEKIITPPEPSFINAYFPTTNIINSVIFVQGKFAVGIGALGITNKSTSQVDKLTINSSFKTSEGDVLSTKLLFAGLENNYSLSDYVDNSNTIISETQSQLLSQFVDNVKNPTAVLMGINMQTANVVDYLIRRGVNPQSIVYFINQPLIKEYLITQKANETIFNKESRKELGKNKIIKNLLEKYNFKDIEFDPTFNIKDADMINAIKKNKIDTYQHRLFFYFLEVQEQSKAFSQLNTTQNSDTKPLKDKQALEESEDLLKATMLSDIIDKGKFISIMTDGIIAPFYQFGRKNYKIYNSLYKLDNFIFGKLLRDFKTKAAKIESGLTKDKVRQTIENDFILFAVHNFGMQNDFDRLMTGPDSMGKRLIKLKDQLPNNAILKEFTVLFSNVKDFRTNKGVDNIRLFQKELTNFDSQDLQESLKEIAEMDPEFYKDLVKTLMYQTGLNISPFNYKNILTVGLDTLRESSEEFEYYYQDLISNALDEILQVNNQQGLFQEFVLLFNRNNPQFLKNNFLSPNNPHLLRSMYKDGKVQLLDRNNKPVQQLGTGSTKYYHIDMSNTSTVAPIQTEEVLPEQPVNQNTSTQEGINKTLNDC